MVFGVVSSEGYIMPPHIFEVAPLTSSKSLEINTKVYLDVLKSVVIPWYNQVAGNRPWVWQQDSTPADKSKETQAWLQKECYDFVPFSHWLPPPPTWTRWTTSFGYTSRTPPVMFWPFDPAAKNAIPRWCTGRKWHIPMAVRRGNRVGGNWLMKWDKVIPMVHYRVMHRKRVTCMTFFSTSWRLNTRFQRSSGRRSII